jgi:hypothetical protein
MSDSFIFKRLTINAQGAPSYFIFSRIYSKLRKFTLVILRKFT